MRLFFSDTFFDKFVKLPREIQNKIVDFQKKFKDDPFKHNINLEPINTFKDSALRTARITLEYRAIIGVLGNGDYSLLYVDHHNEAMEWAKNKKFKWNDNTQAFQLMQVEQTVEQQVPEEVKETLPLSQYSDQQLLGIGVPDEQLQMVRGFRDLNDLGDKEKYLPADAFENLFNLMDGVPIESLLADIEEGKKLSDENDRMTSRNNKRMMIEITGDEEIKRWIDGDFEKWMIFLHPSQRTVVEKNYRGAVKVSGGGGTGKTVAALHRLKLLCAQRPEKKVLFTTFTKTLVGDLKKRIDMLGVEKSRYHLANIDQLVREIAIEHHLVSPNVYVLDYSSEGESKKEQIWNKIIDENITEFDSDFLDREYTDVIESNNNKTQEEYLQQSRVGRNERITRRQRIDVWNLMKKYVEYKKVNNMVDKAELFNMVTNYLNENNDHPYSHVIADEIQDMEYPELRFLRALVDEGNNDLFLVGDPYQRIYSTRKIAFSKAHINVRGRSKRLRVNYRTTEEIKHAAVNVLHGLSYDDLDGGEENLKGYHSIMHGNVPKYNTFPTANEEYDAILKFLRDCHEAGVAYKDMAITCRFRDNIKAIQKYLHNVGDIAYKEINSRTGNSDGVSLSTFHGIKGLEFKVVVIADVDRRTFPYHPLSYETMNTREKHEHDKNERSLVYVALTRAMQYALMTGVGEKANI